MDHVRGKLARDFVATFRSLLNVMSVQEIKERAKQDKEAKQLDSQPMSSGSTSTTRKRPPQSPVSSAPKRTKATKDSPSPRSEPKTPDQPTHPSDPNFTGASIESKDEENTKQLLSQLLMDTLNILEADFRTITWHKSGHFVELSQTSTPLPSSLIISGRDTCKFILGVETVTAINDGGLGIWYNTGNCYTQWQPGGTRPVLSLEVSFRFIKG